MRCCPPWCKLEAMVSSPGTCKQLSRYGCTAGDSDPAQGVLICGRGPVSSWDYIDLAEPQGSDAASSQLFRVGHLLYMAMWPSSRAVAAPNSMSSHKLYSSLTGVGVLTQHRDEGHKLGSLNDNGHCPSCSQGGANNVWLIDHAFFTSWHLDGRNGVVFDFSSSDSERTLVGPCSSSLPPPVGSDKVWNSGRLRNGRCG